MVFCPLCGLALYDGFCAHLNVDAILMSDTAGETLKMFEAMWAKHLRAAPCKER